MSFPWNKIKTSTDAKRKIERLQGVATEPGLTANNIDASGADRAARQRLFKQGVGGASGRSTEESSKRARRHRVKFPSPSKGK